ncbi:MAG: hypothetical protein HGB10_03005 [Coriobacteriia bacterium]|nr:hypothetical protein [Coriobacteriia bacterium]
MYQRWRTRAFSLLVLGVFVAALCALPIDASAGAGWTNQNPETFNAVQFADESVGWAVAGSGAILHTEDGGATWARQSSGTATWLTDVHFIGSTDGWVTGNGGVILHTSDGGGTWSAQTSGTEYDLYSVCFVDANNGWAVGASGVILNTTDGGDNWLPQSSGTLDYYGTVKFTDASNGWVLSGGSLLHTTNGGANWVAQSPSTSEYMVSMDFVDDQTGWIVGGNGLVLATLDGGANWVPQLGASFDWLNSVDFIDASNGWAVGGSGTIQHTSDGGENWDLQSYAAPWVNLYSVSIVDVDNGWAVGEGSTVMSTNDGGTNWSAQAASTVSRLAAVDFIDSSSGWVVGDGGVVLSTTNGGKTLTPQDSTTSENLTSVDFVDDATGWAVGGNGTILGTTDGGANWLTQTSSTTALLSSVAFVDELNGWAVGDLGTILVTADGGSNWDAQLSGTTEYLTSVCFTDALHGWAVGLNDTILQTIDGGLTWTPRPSGDLLTFTSVDFVSTTTGWVAGYDSNSGLPALIGTTDGGLNWTSLAIGEGASLTGVDFVDASNGWVVATDGGVLATTDGGTTWSAAEYPASNSSLNAVCFVDATNGWVVGDGGAVANYSVGYSIQPWAGPGGSIAPYVAQSVQPGADSTFTITPNAGYAIETVLVDDAPIGAVMSYVFTNVTADHNIAAYFVKTWDLTAAPSTNGTITPEGTTTVHEGVDATFTVTADAGYRVGVVTDNGGPVAIDGNGRYVITGVAADHEIAATFIKVWNLTASPGANGAIVPSGVTTVDEGATATFTVTADTGYHVASVTDNSAPVSLVGDEYVINAVAEDHTVAATFAKNVYTLTYRAGANGSVLGSDVQAVEYLASGAEVTAFPDEGYRFVDWSDGVLTASRTDANVTGDIDVTANFEVATYVISATAGANGAISPSGSVITTAGADQTFTFTPAAGYHVSAVTVDSEPVASPGGSYTFTNVLAAHSINVDFAPNPSFVGVITNGATPLNRVVVSAYDAATHAHVKGVFTDAAGAYSLVLPPGSYHLRFTGTTPSSLAQYYDHQSTIASAAVEALAGSEVRTVSSDLAPPTPPSSAVIQGVITSGASPLNRIVVTAFDAGTHAYVKGVFTNAAGEYSLTLPAGSYHLRFTGTTPASLSQYYDHQSMITAAAVIELTGGQTRTISSDLAPAAPGTQSITGVITNGATPLSGIVVSAFDATTHAYVKGTFTGAGGAYALSLPAGSYHVRFTGTTPAGLTQYYDHQARIGAAAIVVLGTGVDTSVSSDLSGAIAP